MTLYLFLKSKSYKMKLTERSPNNFKQSLFIFEICLRKRNKMIASETFKLDEFKFSSG